MQKLIDQVLEWGEQKGITGPNGKATSRTQAVKMMEEAMETFRAVGADDTDEIKDGIGDTTVTLILLAERCGLTLEQCLQAAYDVISKRTGKMVEGTFVKD
jgi:NTP pyrophosphatase (non-canonical NTP hydrolase)